MNKREIVFTTFIAKSKWSITLHRVSQDSAEIWLGTLLPIQKPPEQAKLRMVDENGNKQDIELNRQDWQRAFPKLGQGYYSLKTVHGLHAMTRYDLELSMKPNTEWLSVARGNFTTLPNAIPKQGEAPFTVFLGSCFYVHADKGRAGAAYKALYEHGADVHQPNISFLTGDQVYLDVGIKKLFTRLIPQSWIRSSVAREYVQNRKALGSLLSRGGNWFLVDDHEYWNDYPFVNHILPKIIGLGSKRVRTPWEETARDGVENIQRTHEIDSFNIGRDLSFCVADFRGKRTLHGFTSEENLERVVQWAEGLSSPGVLVIPQPLMVEKREEERNMLAFEDQYAKLVLALAECNHDIVVLSGDAHFGRIASVPIGRNGNTLVEIIASPMSNLSGFYALANQTVQAPPSLFPHPDIAHKTGLTANEVQYNNEYSVSEQKGAWFSPYWKDRTKEHFMTIGFEKLSNGNIELSAEAWRVREQSKLNKLPVKDFNKTYKIQLR